MTDEISLNTLLKDVSPSDVDGFLKSFEKYERLFDKGISVMEKLEKMGIMPAIIRSAGAKAGIKDLDKPLQNPLTFTARTPAHFQFYRVLNDLAEEGIEEMHAQLLAALKIAREEAEVKPKEEEPKKENVEV